MYHTCMYMNNSLVVNSCVCLVYMTCTHVHEVAEMYMYTCTRSSSFVFRMDISKALPVLYLSYSTVSNQAAAHADRTEWRKSLAAVSDS